jgi:hypothetical protein
MTLKCLGETDSPWKKTRSRKSRYTVPLTLFAFSSPSLSLFFTSGFLSYTRVPDLFYGFFRSYFFPAREARERWPLHIAEIESNGDSKSTNERSPSLVGSNGDLPFRYTGDRSLFPSLLSWGRHRVHWVRLHKTQRLEHCPDCHLAQISLRKGEGTMFFTAMEA